MEGLPRTGRNVGEVGRLAKSSVFRLGCCRSRDVSAGCCVYFSFGAEFHFASLKYIYSCKPAKILVLFDAFRSSGAVY